MFIKVLLEYSHAHSFTYGLWLNWVVLTETIYTVKPKIFTTWLFKKTLVKSWSGKLNKSRVSASKGWEYTQKESGTLHGEELRKAD